MKLPMRMATPGARTVSGAAGQVLVVMVGGLFAVIAVVALVVDGGNAWSNQRIVQNGADAAASAGAVVMAKRLAYQTTGTPDPAGGWDPLVQSAIASNAAASGITVTAAYYTDICGIPLKPDGTASLNGDGSYDFADAARVGSGTLPDVLSVTPVCPTRVSGPPAGVIVLGTKNVGTYFAGAIGLSSITVSAQATAAAGWLQEQCDATQGVACALLPIAVPTLTVTCATNGKAILGDFPWPADGTTVVSVPLCNGSGNGNVGWIDWYVSGGASTVLNEIITPNNPAITLPSWQYVAQTGGPNSQNIQTALRAYDGQTVLIPQFDQTCGLPQSQGSPSDAWISDPGENYGCLNASSNYLNGNGQNTWYSIPSFAHFQLCVSTDPACAAYGATFGLTASQVYGAYTNGSDPGGICGTGTNQCLVGKFESFTTSGVIGAGGGGSAGGSVAIGTQLIK